MDDIRQVALEVLSYHNAASIEEVELICGEARPTQEENQELASWVTIKISPRPSLISKSNSYKNLTKKGVVDHLVFLLLTLDTFDSWYDNPLDGRLAKFPVKFWTILCRLGWIEKEEN